MTTNYTLISKGRCQTGESPVWVAQESALYWVDIPAGKIYRWQASSDELSQWQMPEMAGSMAMCATGGWIVAMETGIYLVQLQSNGASTHEKLADVEHPTQLMRINVATGKEDFYRALCSTIPRRVRALDLCTDLETITN